MEIPKSVKDTLIKLTGEKATLKDQAIVRLYTADFDSKWIYSSLCGILTLSIDRSLQGALFFRLYDPATYDLLFENELYYNFINSYKKLQDSFYAYDVVQGYIGFLFSDDATAENFKKSVTQLNKKMEEKDLKKIHKKKFDKNEGIFSKITSFFSGNKTTEKTTQIISKPTNVQQNMSIKFDFEKGKFDLQSLSPEMKRIFKKAGIEKKDLLDREFAPVLFEKILLELNQEAQEEKKEEGSSNNQNKEIDISCSTNIVNNKVPPPPPLNIPPPPSLNIPKAPVINFAALPKPEVTTLQQTTQQPSEEKNVPKPQAQAGGGREDLLEQIRNRPQLKKVDPNEKKEEKQLLSVKINQQVEESLTMTLARAIVERRKQITKNDHTDSEESPWSDSD